MRWLIRSFESWLITKLNDWTDKIDAETSRRMGWTQGGLQRDINNKKENPDD